MKKIAVFFALVISSLSFCVYSEPQAYKSIRLKERTRTDYESSEGIQAQIKPEGDGYSITLFNSNYNDSNDFTTYTFKWYLCYKGNRVSDYHQERMKCRDTEKKVVYAWPGEVPRGNEKYVTIQFGEEPRKKDRRD